MLLNTNRLADGLVVSGLNARREEIDIERRCGMDGLFWETTHAASTLAILQFNTRHTTYIQHFVTSDCSPSTLQD